MEETVDATGTLIEQKLAYKLIINAEVQLDHGDHITKLQQVRSRGGRKGPMVEQLVHTMTILC
eukprot:8853554-Ditylum_brightwellii.AAC.1